MEDAADVQKGISSNVSMPIICRLPLDVSVTKAISWDESNDLSLISSTLYISLMSDNTRGTDLLKSTMTQFLVARGPIIIVICKDVVNSGCLTILRNNVAANVLTNEKPWFLKLQYLEPIKVRRLIYEAYVPQCSQVRWYIVTRP
jgi:hypothetical protein